MNWQEYSENNVPELKRYVLIQVSGSETMPPSVVVGYIKKHSEGGYYFVWPGCNINPSEREATHWCDCLGDDFKAPLWAGQPKKKK